MSREAGRVRALLNAARLRHVLESRERVELLGYALVAAEHSGGSPDAAGRTGARHDAAGGHAVRRQDA